MDNIRLAENLVTLRKVKKITQEQLADFCGVTKSSVSKWETGESSPDINKLLALSKTFEVTTDWLLSDEDPYEENKTEDRYNYSENAYNQTRDDNEYFDNQVRENPLPKETWVDRVPGALGRMLKRYGWLFGVRLAVGGALFIAIGAIAKFIVGKMLSSFSNMSHSMFDGFGSFTDVTIEGFGNMPEIQESINQGNNMLGSFFEAQQTMIQNNPVSIMGSFIIGLGVVFLIAGIILAIVLKKKSKE